MTARHVLHVGPHGLVAMRETGRGTWRISGRFPAQAEVAAIQAAAFADWLRAHPRDRFDLLVDVLDEEQHAEDLPRLGARDSALLVRRRIEQRYRDAEFAMATPLKATVDSRRGRDAGPTHPVLLSAIRSPQSLAPWVPKLIETERAVGAMLSPALLAPRVAKRIAPHASGLLASVGPSGLRQTLIIDGRLRFSRLAAGSDGRDPVALRAELARTLQYVQMAQVVAPDAMRDEAFRVWLLVEDLVDADPSPWVLTLDSGLRITVSPHRIAALGAPMLLDEAGVPARLGALPLWLDPALRRPLGRGYASATLRRHATLALWRRSLWAVGGTALAASVGALAVVELGGRQAVPDAVHVAVDARRADAERVRLEAVLAAHPMPGSEIEALVTTASRLARRQVDAPRLLHGVAAAMPADGGLRLTGIGWARDPLGRIDAAAGAAGASAAPGPAGPSTPTAGTGFVPLPPLGTTPPVVGSSPATTPAAILTPVEVTIRGTVDADRPKTDANALVEALSGSLRAGCGCTVEVRQWPYERGPAGEWTEELERTAPRDKGVPFVVGLRIAEVADAEGADAPRR